MVKGCAPVLKAVIRVLCWTALDNFMEAALAQRVSGEGGSEIADID